jgi:GNAT superfamily N-acetyltransferase
MVEVDFFMSPDPDWVSGSPEENASLRAPHRGDPGASQKNGSLRSRAGCPYGRLGFVGFCYRDFVNARIRAATPADADLLMGFVRELAEYERLADKVRGDAAQLARHLAEEPPVCSALVAEVDGRAVGFALFFTTYSTFETAPCLHLEDLYVTPNQRGRGVGRQLLAGVAAVAVARGCPRLEWRVLDWNADAIGFYRKLGATVLGDWRVCRLAGDQIARVARGD